MTDTIYRIQAEDGRGPYRPGFSGAWVDADHDRRNPSITAEFGLRLAQSFPAGAQAGCGFFSVAALTVWFSDAERETLARLGYYVAEIEDCTVYAVGDLQVLAWRRRPFVYCRRIPLAALGDVFRTDYSRAQRLSENGRKGGKGRHGNPRAAASPAGMEAGAADPD
jgi:hypothetical protein